MWPNKINFFKVIFVKWLFKYNLRNLKQFIIIVKYNVSNLKQYLVFGAVVTK